MQVASCGDRGRCASSACAIHVWQHYASELLRLYAQIHHQSVAATVRGDVEATGRGAGGGAAPGVRGRPRRRSSDIRARARSRRRRRDLIEVTQRMEPDACAAAVAHWIELLVDAFPRVMEKFGSPVLERRCSTGRSPRRTSPRPSLPAGSTIAAAPGVLSATRSRPASVHRPPRPQLPASRLIAGARVRVATVRVRRQRGRVAGAGNSAPSAGSRAPGRPDRSAGSAAARSRCST